MNLLAVGEVSAVEELSPRFSWVHLAIGAVLDDVDLVFVGGVVGVDVIPHVHACDISDCAGAAVVRLELVFGDVFDGP